MPEAGAGPAPDDPAQLATKVMRAVAIDRPLTVSEKLRFALWLIARGPDQMVVVKHLATELIEDAERDLHEAGVDA